MRTEQMLNLHCTLKFQAGKKHLGIKRTLSNKA